MKVKVLKRYRDRNTSILHKSNTEIEITAGRFTEINGTAAGVLVEEIKKPTKKQVK